MQLKAVLFDLDGTVFDTESQYSVFWGRMGRLYLPDLPDFARRIKGTTLTQILNRYFPGAELQAHITSLLDEWEGQMEFPFIRGAEDFVRQLRRAGVATAVVTSSNERKMQQVRRKVSQFGGLFSHVLTAEMFKASKPDPDCFLQGMQVCGADRETCVVFEDAFTGLEAGMRSGAMTIGLATTNPADALRGKCDKVVADFTGLSPQLLDRLLVEHWRSRRKLDGYLMKDLTTNRNIIV